MGKPVFILTATKLERFRKWYDGLIDEDNLVQSIKGTMPWNRQMNFGTAYHMLLEHGGEPYYDGVKELYKIRIPETNGTIILTKKQAAPGLNHRCMYPGMVHEVKVQQQLITSRIIGNLYMKVDGFNGNEIHENKTTERNVRIDDYESSLQWQLYLLSTGATFVQYNVFRYIKHDDGSPTTVLPVFSFKLHPYPGMLQNCKDWADMYVDYCKGKGLLKHIESRY